MTKALHDALKTVNVALHDHLIIGRDGITSFRSQGLL
jgi:DNA repair protein RadC